ncbi:response regulator [Arthrobacter sp. MA-N2]|uniref:response regulator n=1 Tax=Arthrobacter sp. MA-N2 TaxID=1101188 RepID=UPI000483C27C|nr:response regulator transcription factor [Arthrobacter sp. MA-N2]
MKTITVFIADDHPVYREGLARNWESVPQINVIGSAGDGKNALAAIRKLKPDVAVMDINLPELDGMQVLESLFAEESPTRVLVLTAYMDSTSVYRAFAHGARGFLEKAASFSEITDAVLQIGAGATIIAPFAQDVLARELRTRRETTEKPTLTPRELEIVRLAADGYSGQKIASELHVSLATVKTHLQHIYDKLDVSDRASAVAQAIRRGFLR